MIVQWNVLNLNTNKIIGIHFEPKIENVMQKYGGVGYMVYAVCAWKIKNYRTNFRWEVPKDSFFMQDKPLDEFLKSKASQ
jgi:hypothetical protein